MRTSHFFVRIAVFVYIQCTLGIHTFVRYMSIILQEMIDIESNIDEVRRESCI